MRCVVVDVEASGLDLLEDRLISIGAVAVCGGRIVLGDSYSAVLQQETASGRDNILLHGIGGSAQTGGVPPDEALLGFLAFLGKNPLVAFHAAFDEAMIKRAIKRYLGFTFRHPWLDLAYVMPALHRELARGNKSLDDWTTLFHIHIAARHDALADALATAQLLQVAMARAGAAAGATFRDLRNLEKAQRWEAR
jgi:DNA polymerase-3 subunit epsilon